MRIGVLGAGTMGAGIAQIAATAGHEVILTDTSEQAIIKARDGLTRILNRLVEKGKMTDQESKEIFGRIYFSESMSAYEGCGLVIEAIIENMEIKKKVFSQLESVVDSNCILATNTSSLSIASIAAGCDHAERVIGIHFFNPAPVMKLVEIIPAIQTSQETLDKSFELIEGWGKTVVEAKDTPGFIVNRIARPFYGEALRILEEGIADVPTIDLAMTQVAGFRMGPFTLMDYIGNDVNYAVTESVFTAFYFDPRYKPSFTQKRLAEAGWLGRKTGRGYYNYVDLESNPQPKSDQVLLQMIADRIIVMLINEAADAVYLNIASLEDIELAMTKGVNYPKGLLTWANDTGIKKCVKRMDKLYDFYREDRYKCSPLLRKMADKKEHFALMHID